MAITIDGLQIEITENSEAAVSGLDALTASLEKLKKVTSGLEKSLEGVNFDKFSKQMKLLSTSLQPLQGFKTQASGLLSALRHFKTMAEDFNNFTRFDKFASQIKLLANSLEPLSNFSTKLGATLNALTQLPTISEQLKSMDFKSFGENIKTLVEGLSPLGDVKSRLGAALNQLSRFGQVIQQLDMVFKNMDVASKILTLVKVLEPLNTLGKSQLGSILNQLKKLPDIMKQLTDIDSSDMDRFTNQINRVVNALKPLADEMNKIAAGFSAFPSRIQRIISQNERLVNSNRKLEKSYNILGISFKSVHARLGVMYFALRKLSSKMADWVMESTSYVENLNLFRISMREASDEALNYAFKVREVFGIDPSEWIRFQAVFQNMATGFGITGDKAAIMSKNLTQLGYDLATVFNVSYETAMQKLQSALAGQPRPMREWGFDMSEATLKLVALRHNVQKNVETMTQYEKSQLRYLQLMETATKQGIIGNFARELHTPANALRILNQQLLFFKRTLGDAIIPILIKVLPYLQAFVIVLTDMIRVLADFMGFELPKIDYSGLDALGADTEQLSDGLEDATTNAKKLKNIVAGFDELNIISQDSSGTGQEPNVFGAGGLDLDLEQFNYDVFGEIENKVNQIAENLRKPFENILDIVIKIGVIIASWKISNALYSLFTGGGTNSFVKAVNTLGKGFISPSGETVKLASLLGDSTAYVSTATVLAGIATTVSIIVLRFIDLIKKSERFRDGLSVIGEGLKKGVEWVKNTAIPAIGDFFKNLIPDDLKNAVSKVFQPIQDIMKELDIDSNDWLLTLGSIALLFTPAAPFATAILIFEGITLGIRALGWAASDAVEEIDILGDGISDVTKDKMKPFLDQMREIENALTDIDWRDLVIDESIFNDISTKIKGISKLIIDELDGDKNEALKNLEPLKNALGEEAYNELIAKNTTYYENLKTQVTDNEKEILRILEQAKKDNRTLTEDENKEISRLREEMKKTGIRHLTETEVEYQIIMNRMKENSTRVSAEQASQIIQDARRTMEETTADAEEQYARIELEAQRMLEVGAINEEEYDRIIEAAKEAKEDTITKAEDQYDKIEEIVKEKLGETARYIDFETGEIKSKWKAFTEGVKEKWDEEWDNIKEKFETWKTLMGESFDKFKTNFKKGWCGFWNSIGNFFIDIWNGIVGGFESAVNKVIGGLNKLMDSYNDVVSKIPGIGDKITISTISKVSFGRVPRLSIPEFAMGGFPDIGQLFIAREAGPELVGSIGKRTVVSNNEQIIEGIRQGVYEAVKAATPSQTEQPLEVKVYLDGKQITHAVEKVKRERGASLLPGGVVFG